MSATLTTDAPRPASGTTAPTISELVSGILDDGQKLLKQQIDMLRAEIREDFLKTRDVVIYLGVGVGLTAFGGVMLLVALVYLLQYLTGWHLAACWGSVGGAAVLVGGVAFLLGYRVMASYNPLPDKTFNALTENVSWIAKTQPQT